MASVSSLATLPAARSFGYWFASYRRTWRGSIVTNVLSPVMYLAAMGVGLGSLVKSGSGTNGLPYLQFVAPGLLAATAMQVAVGESTYPVLGSFKWVRNYHAMAATPLSASDILFGHMMWIAARLAATSGIYLAVLAAFGAIRSPLAVLALPVGILVGLAFAAPIAAYSATRESDSSFAALQRFGMVPMFLFSGTFFTVAQLPVGIQQIAYATPLWHGVRLARDLTTGQLEAGAAWLVPVHVIYLLAWAAVGILVALRHYRARLAK